MVIKKKPKTFSDYSVELSWGQLTAIRNSLAADHSSPISDEMYAELTFYLEQLPGPGESEEEMKAEEEAAKSGLASPEADGQPLKPSADDLLPSPGKEEAGAPSGEERPEEGPPPDDLAAEQAPEDSGAEGPESDEGAESEADRRLPPPPRE